MFFISGDSVQLITCYYATSMNLVNVHLI